VYLGNVGCGKSSLLGHFSTKFPSAVEALSEPVDRWRDVCGHNLLQLMYEDPSRWSLAFQR
jgi:deoxyadenosine/deoxycytidine kinase